MKIRAKLYVSRVERTERCNTVHFNAVVSSKEGTENNTFWRYTPSAQLSLELKHDDPRLVEMVPGSFWYVDTEHIDETTVDATGGVGRWKIGELSRPPNSTSLRVKLYGPEGVFDVNICNQAVWSAYDRIGRPFELTFAPAKRD